MSKCKLFKDPIYGYIEIDETIVANIIDTAEFQRLRNVIQTSYAPLYPTAVHNRFVHSLGVYHLGHIVTKSITDYINKHSFEYEKTKCGTERYFELFELACLLHDLGHAPFSHTGEANYLNEGKRDLLHKSITALTNDADLQTEIDQKNYKAAPHELMSVIVALNSYQSLFRSDEEKSFFARCILGYPYVIKKGLNTLF